MDSGLDSSLFSYGIYQSIWGPRPVSTESNFIPSLRNTAFSSSWEVPALVDNKIAYVSDSDGVSYPWYGSGTEIATVTGPNDHFTELKIKMNDNFHPSVTWDVPISERDAPHLTKITRDQSFITWLAAVNENTNKECVRLV